MNSEHNELPVRNIGIFQKMEDAKKAIAIIVFFILTTVAVLNFVATKNDIKKLSCKIDLQFNLTQLYRERGEKESVLAGLIKEANSISVQLGRGLITSEDFFSRHNSLEAEQKEIREKIGIVTDRIDNSELLRVTDSCPKKDN